MRNKDFGSYALYVLLSFSLMFFMFSIMSSARNDRNSVEAVSSVSLSNKKVAWGMSRGDGGAQPDFGSLNRELLANGNRDCSSEMWKSLLFI